MTAEPARDGSPYRAMRVRVTAVSAAVVLLVLAAAAVALAVAHRAVLVGNLEESLDVAAADLAAAYEGGDRSPTLAGIGDDDAAYQIVDPGGRVVASSANLEGEAAIAPGPGGGGDTRTVHGLPHDRADFLVHSRTLDGGLTVHVAATLDDIDDSARALRGALAVVVPVAAALLAGVLWVLVGRLLERAAAADVRQRRFVADASHELRNPLTRMRTELEVDLAHPGRADPLATHRVVLDEAIGMQHLVDDLLQLARLDGRPPRAEAVVDLDAVAGRIAGDLRAAGTTVDTSGVAAVQVRGDADQLRRLVANLADNAARHAAGVVSFEVADVDGRAVLAVADDGPGIPAADRERVFERFSRVDQARSGGGTGLGLAIAREIAVAHGGEIHVDPAHTPGARLVVTLPTAEPPRSGGR